MLVLVMLELFFFARLLSIVQTARKNIILLMNVILNIPILLFSLTLLNQL